MSIPVEARFESLPVNPKSGDPIEPMAHPGYYPGYSTLSQKNYWDEATRNIVLKRVQNVPEIRFFSTEEARLMAAVCDRIIPQDDRDAEHKIPIMPFIDKRLHEGRIDGYRYESMPPDREAHRLGLKAIDQIAQHLYSVGFLNISPGEQERVLKTIHDGNPPAADEIWKQMPAHRYWMLLVQDCVEVYYAHPWAWDEIGYGGPAYPRAYMRLERGQAEPWEVNERHYEWEAPPDSISDTYDFIAGEGEHRGTPGQGGTH